MIRWITFGFALLFVVVVGMGYVPSFVTAVHGQERMLFDLFKISLLDDITHGVTAVAALLAAVLSRRASLLFLTAFGFYYALDAIFFLTYGVASHQPVMDNLMLNAPHVGISTVMLALVYVVAPREERALTFAPTPGAPAPADGLR